MPTTSENIADSIATQYAGAMDNMIADAARMEAERDEARAQLATLTRLILALALRLRNRTAFIATLGGHELQGNVIGPLALMTTDYQDPLIIGRHSARDSGYPSPPALPSPCAPPCNAIAVFTDC